MKIRRSLNLFPLYVVLIVLIGSGQAFALPKGLAFLEEIEASLVSLADRVRPAVVSLSPYVPPSPSVKSQESRGRGRPANAGAGVIVDGEKGYIITNSHVVRNSEKIQVTLFGGKKLVGRILGMDEDTDLALVQVDTEQPLASVPFGDSAKLKVGQMVVAVGNPYGLNDTLTFGIISGLNRENVNLSRYEDFIQTDASINPGNSGGPLFNIRGEVIGINTAIINYAQSIGFSIPSNMVRRVVSQLIKFGEVKRGWLGVGIEPVTRELALEAKIQEGDGVLINAVFEGDPADQAGLKVGDIILKVGGTRVDSPSRMIRVIGSVSPGQTVNLDILRGGKMQVIQVKLDQQRKERHLVAVLPKEDIPPLGLEVAPLEGNLSGIQISKVFESSLAQEKGIVPGDRILAVNGEKVASTEQFDKIIEKVPTGGSVYLLLMRNEDKIHLALVR